MSIDDATAVTPDLVATVTSTRRFPFLVAASLAFLAVTAILVIFGEAIAPYDPYGQDLAAAGVPPSTEHWLGTDHLGRDVLTRTIVGARTAVVGPLLIAFGAAIIGAVLGLVAGYLGGWIDGVILRWVDLMYALPQTLVAIVVVGVLGGGYVMAVAVLIVLTSPFDTRIIRAATLEQRPRPYVESARILGISNPRIMLHHILPNIVPIISANTFLSFAYAVIALASLSFLGLGVGPGTADWGRMLAEGRSLLFENAAAALAPGAMIVLAAASMTWVGDWLDEWFSGRGRAH